MADISSINLNGNSYNIKDNNAVSKNDIIDIAHGGTGKTSHTTNAILTGNGTNAVNNIATASGAFYATTTNGVAQFGTLPTTQGGTGNTEGKAATAVKLAQNRRLLAYLANKYDSTTTNSNYNGQWDLSGNTAIPVYGTLGIANGGTGKTTKDEAWANLGGGDIGKKDSLLASDIPSLDASKITTGTLAVGRGGTGAATATANYVFAAPNGSNGTPSFRKLVASDIPSLDASKITTGTLAVGRGGTGVTTYSALAPQVGISTLQIAAAGSDTYTFKSSTNGEFAIVFCERGGRAGIYMVDYNTANSVKLINIGSIDPLITIQHSANNLNVTITNNNSVTMKITIIEMNTTN